MGLLSARSGRSRTPLTSECQCTESPDRARHHTVAGINTEADNEVRSSERSRHTRSPEDVL